MTERAITVIKNEPDMGSLPADTPLAIRSLLRRCLQKEPLRRLQHIGDVRVEIEDVLATPLALWETWPVFAMSTFLWFCPHRILDMS